LRPVNAGGGFAADLVPGNRDSAAVVDDSVIEVEDDRFGELHGRQFLKQKWQYLKPTPSEPYSLVMG
jgi:predicted phosphodiesterase